jgi:hypothetical protein
MTVKFKPLDLTPHWMYGVDYWNMVAQDTAELSWNLTGDLKGNFLPLLVILSIIEVILNVTL